MIQAKHPIPVFTANCTSRRMILQSLRSWWCLLTSPLVTWCACVSVSESECREYQSQTGAGRQVLSCHACPPSALMPATAGKASGCADEAEPAPVCLNLVESYADLSPLLMVKEQQSQSDKSAPCPETAGGCLAPSSEWPSTVTGPTTPPQLSPVASRGLSQVSLATQDNDRELATTVIGERRAVSSSDDSSSDSTTTNTSSSSVKDGKLSYGVFTSQNTRQYQEDRAIATALCSSEHGLGFTRVGVAAVFDGHGGSEASEHLQQHMVPELLQQLQLESSSQQALSTAAQQLEAQLLSSGCTAGSTLTAALVLDDQLVVAQVGDSRAILCRGDGKAVQLTSDHNPSTDGERARIAAADPSAEISSDGYCYGMGVSRGLGSYHLQSDSSKPAFTAAADVTQHQLELLDDFIVLGSDGLFDCLSNYSVVTTARRALAAAGGDCTAAAQALVDRAIAMGSSDNVTAVVMLLHNRKIVLAKSNSRLFINRD